MLLDNPAKRDIVKQKLSENHWSKTGKYKPKISEEGKDNLRKSKNKVWLIIFPDYHQETIFDLTLFCKLNQLDRESLYRTSKRKQKQHEGFRATLLSS